MDVWLPKKGGRTDGLPPCPTNVIDTYHARAIATFPALKKKKTFQLYIECAHLLPIETTAKKSEQIDESEKFCGNLSRRSDDHTLPHKTQEKEPGNSKKRHGFLYRDRECENSGITRRFFLPSLGARSYYITKLLLHFSRVFFLFHIRFSPQKRLQKSDFYQIFIDAQNSTNLVSNFHFFCHTALPTHKKELLVKNLKTKCYGTPQVREIVYPSLLLLQPQRLLKTAKKVNQAEKKSKKNIRKSCLHKKILFGIKSIFSLLRVYGQSC